MRKDWVLIGIIGLILIVGLGLISYLKLSKKQVVANPEPSSPTQNVAAATDSSLYFSQDAKVMYFYSDFCHWCQKEKEQVLPELGKEGYKLKPMNVGENPDLAKKYNITGTPTFVAANGDQLVGYQTADALKDWLNKHQG